jgi:membrane fusion protein (multidrug efflux system)
MIVASSTLNAQIEIPGTILANESTEIHPESSGRLVLLNVKEGALVGKGTLLAKLYDGDMLAQLNSLNVQIKSRSAVENCTAIRRSFSQIIENTRNQSARL